ncbi:hypothetical protein ILUMI_23568 [Ignelater luminosus]|uniref:Uncharacterized protein n=1 Tax=Ignelater luminosus TaxID=2038154 RepID=A0A8K0FWV6_IGNLU|nr:hypothetical protein ILUMI_23568 [Ignelater luminosus]
MSQKVVKRNRRHTEEEGDQEFKNPGSSKAKEESHKNAKEESNIIEGETNGLKEESDVKTNGENGEVEVDSPKRVIQTRSRSNTPLKKDTENKGNVSESEADVKDGDSFSLKIDESDTDKSKDLNESKDKEADKVEGEENEKGDTEQALSDSLEIEPLTEKDEEEAIPELQYDENDLDLESEGSPSRCRTRRSQTRNVSTPKTPKLVESEAKVLYIPMERLSETPKLVENEAKELYIPVERFSEGNTSGSSTPRKMAASSRESNVDSESQPDEIADSDSYSSVSIDNISTKAMAGSDATRNADLTYQDSGLFDENPTSTPLVSPNRSLAETLRGLSSRRTIRPIMNSNYRKIALQNTLEANKGDVYANYECIERVTPGMKRKNRSITPEEAKRFKKEGTGLFSYISSPLFSHFKNTLSKSSTPKLISYEKKQSGYGEPIKPELEIPNEDQQKKWCSIM